MEQDVLKGEQFSLLYYESNEDLVKISTLVDGKESSFTVALKAKAPFQLNTRKPHLYENSIIHSRIHFILHFT